MKTSERQKLKRKPNVRVGRFNACDDSTKNSPPKAGLSSCFCFLRIPSRPPHPPDDQAKYRPIAGSSSFQNSNVPRSLQPPGQTGEKISTRQTSWEGAASTGKTYRRASQPNHAKFGYALRARRHVAFLHAWHVFSCACPRREIPPHMQPSN